MPDDAPVAPDLAHHGVAEDLRVLRRRRAGQPARRRAWRPRARRWRWSCGLAACHFSIPSSPPSSAGAKPLPFTVAMWTTTGRCGLQRVAQGTAQRAHVVAVDDADVRPAELLPPQSRRPEGLDRLLELRAEALEALADAAGQLGEPLLDALARVVELGVEPDAVEVAAQRADVRRDRHAVVVEHDDHRGLQPAGLVHRLEGDAAGHRAVADDGDDLPRVDLAAVAHALLQPDGVADRRGGVARAHDVVLGLEDRAERREALVLADRRKLVAAAGEDLVRIGLMADVPEHLVARRVQQRVQRDRQLARAEVRAEVPADLADRVDDVLAKLPRDLVELVVAERMKVLRAVDPVQEAGGHPMTDCRMSSPTASRDERLRGPRRDEVGDRRELGGAVASDALQRAVGLLTRGARHLAGPVEPELA